MRRWLFALMLALCLSSAYAEIPLVLEATIPTGGAFDFDIQHWASDSTYGYAYVTSNAIHWVENLGDPVQTAAFPWARQARLLRSPDQQSTPKLAVYTDETYYDVYLNIFNPTTSQVESRVLVLAYDPMGYNSWTTWTRSDFIVWPQPPAVTSWIAVGGTYGHHGMFPPEHGYDEYSDLTYFCRLTATALTFERIVPGREVSPFCDTSATPRFALWGQYSYYPWPNGSSEYAQWISWWRTNSATVAACTLCAPGGPCASGANYPGRTCTAQEDADGFQRVLLRRPESESAINPDSFSTLWQNTISNDGVWSARIEEDAGERLLLYDAQLRRLVVCDASTGNVIDTTSEYLGDVHQIIRSPNTVSEIVTWDTLQTARVYTFRQSSPGGLVCEFDPVEQLIRLRWRSLPGALRYYVYSSSNPSTVEYWEGTVTTPGHSFDLVPEESKRFYFVTAEYGDGGTIGRARHAVPLRQTHAGRAR